MVGMITQLKDKLKPSLGINAPVTLVFSVFTEVWEIQKCFFAVFCKNHWNTNSGSAVSEKSLDNASVKALNN